MKIRLVKQIHNTDVRQSVPRGKEAPRLQKGQTELLEEKTTGKNCADGKDLNTSTKVGNVGRVCSHEEVISGRVESCIQSVNLLMTTKNTMYPEICRTIPQILSDLRPTNLHALSFGPIQSKIFDSCIGHKTSSEQLMSKVE